jgi:hypothetical protein
MTQPIATQTDEPVYQSVTMPTAVRIIVTYTARVPTVPYAHIEAQTMAIVDLPPNSTPADAVMEAGALWRSLHEEYGTQIAEIITEPRDNWDKIQTQPKDMQSIITVFKTMFGNLSQYVRKS